MFCLLTRLGCKSIGQFHPIFLEINARSLSVLNKIKSKHLVNPEKHRVIYKYPFIRVPAVFILSKYYVFLGSLLSSVCFTCIGESAFAVPVILSGVIHYALMSLAGKFLNNTVGAVCVNKKGDIDEVIVCSINSSGRRIDRQHKPEEIFLCEYYNKFTMRLGFVTFAVQHTGIAYHINLKDGYVYDSDALKFLLGTTSLSLDKNPKKL